MSFPSDLPALTSLRFVLAMGVVLFHYQLQWVWSFTDFSGLLERARLGVDAFFILSGFVLTHAYRQAIAERRLNYRRFLVARLARVYPAHLAVLALVLVMVGVASLLGDSFDRSLYNLPGLLATVTLTHAWFPGPLVAEWNGPSWSLSAEWFAYLAFPVFAGVGFVLRRRPILLLALTAAAFVLIDQGYRAAFGDTVLHAETRLGIAKIVPEFLYGVALYRLGGRLSPPAWLAQTVAIGAVVAVLVTMHLRGDERLIVVLSGVAILALALLSKTQSEGPWASPALVAAGEASYALYLLHMPLLIGWKGAISVMIGQPSSYLLASWEVVALLLITIAAALLLYAWVEQPARTWVRALSDRLWPPRDGAQMAPGSQPPDV